MNGEPTRLGIRNRRRSAVASTFVAAAAASMVITLLGACAGPEAEPPAASAVPPTAAATAQAPIATAGVVGAADQPGRTGHTTATVPSGSVFHARATTTMTATGQAGSRTATHELWWDPERGEARYEVRDETGHLTQLEARSGRVKVTWLDSGLGGRPDINAVIAPDEARMMDVGEMMTMGRAVDHTAMEPAGEHDELRGTPAVRMALPAYSSGEMPPMEYWYAEDTGLMLRETGLRPDGSGIDEVRDWDYEVVEYLPRSGVPDDLFTALPPETAGLKDISGQWYMTPEEAAAFAGFAVFWLGAEFNGLPLGQTGIVAEYSAPTAAQLFQVPRTEDIHSVDLHYSNLFLPPSSRPPGTIELRQEPNGQALRRRAAAGDQPTPAAEAEQIGEAAVRFCCAENEAQVQIGDTSIELSGDSEAQLRRAIEGLAALNPSAR